MDDDHKIIAFHRWDIGGPSDDVVVVANFHHEPQDTYVIGFPAAGPWKLRFNSDWQGYSDDFHNHPGGDVVAEAAETDALPFHAALSIGAYSVLIYSQ
jgi:1,4-alpha-glucan branching enzyme